MRVFITYLKLAKYSPIDDSRKAREFARLNSTKWQRFVWDLYKLIKRPHAVEYARIHIGWANRRGMLKSELMSSTQMIEKPDATDKPDTVLEAEEGCIHKG